MTRLIFKAADLLRVVDHSLAAPKQAERLINYTDEGPVSAPPEAPAVLLVHDDGVYLMSNGHPADALEGKPKGKFFKRYVAYAQGCDPRSDKGWYDTARALVGGDDFGECLPWAAEIKAQIAAGAQEIIIEVSGDSLALVERS
ncbi:Protein of unknown function [Bradyrhizobium erythrophlei]|nr:Protein of unknown function [Bradyrhizobium erythrophlei]